MKATEENMLATKDAIISEEMEVSLTILWLIVVMRAIIKIEITTIIFLKIMFQLI